MISTEEKRRDLLISLAIFLLSLLYTLPFIGIGDFYRHTESDRALIGWEMWERKDFIVPHLLGDTYTTKPPGFYWLIALSCGLFSGELSEFAARLPSAIFASLLLAGQFLLLRRITVPFAISLLSSLILFSNPLFFEYSTKGEIDMTFGAVCSLGVFLLFSLVLKRKPLVDQGILASDREVFSLNAPIKDTIFCAIIFSFAWLVKGPQSFFLLFVGVSFIIFRYLYSSSERLKERGGSLFSPANPLILVPLISFVVFLIWFFLLQSRVGWEEISYRFNEEVLQRVVSDRAGGRARNILFYPINLLLIFLPWSLVGLTVFLKNLISQKKIKNQSFLRLIWGDIKKVLDYFLCRKDGGDRSIELQAFCLVLVCSLLAVLSISSGKANRYLFPVVPIFTVPLAYYLMRTMPRILKYALAVVILCFLIRIVYSFYFVPLKSREYNVPELASKIEQTLQSQDLAKSEFQSTYSKIKQLNWIKSTKPPLFIVETTKRWINFYLNKLGRVSLRLTPELVRDLCRNSTEDPEKRYLYLLFDSLQEENKLSQFMAMGAQRLGEFEGKKQRFVMLKVDSCKVKDLSLSRYFPTNIS